MGTSGRHATHVRTRCWAYIGGIGILLICWLAVIAGKAVGRASLARRAAQSLAEQTEGSRNLVLRNRRGIEVHLLRTGASIQKLLLPDRNGKFADVVLGFDEEVAYSDGRSPYFGAIVGRVANRIANASFELDSATYRLATRFDGTLRVSLRALPSGDKVPSAAAAMRSACGTKVPRAKRATQAHSTWRSHTRSRTPTNSSKLSEPPQTHPRSSTLRRCCALILCSLP
jgi:hypothetical protein